MKIEKQINFIIKKITLKHLLFFIVINSICFYLSFNHFSKQKDFTYETTLEIKIPRYKNVEVGDYITILRLDKIYSKLDTLNKNSFFIKKCKIIPNQYDKHIYYFDEKKFISSFNLDIPLIVKIIHPNKNIARDCAKTIVEIIQNEFELKKVELLNIIEEKMKLNQRWKKEKKIALKNLINKLQEEDSDLFKDFLVKLYFDNLQDKFLDVITSSTEIEYSQNQNLEVRSEIFIKKLKINNFVYQKALVVNLFVTFLLIISFIFSLRKKI
tara:strand:+ start:39 stop:845 length:807 start_codon:yes stop_codon:yes gene_type:complete